MHPGTSALKPFIDAGYLIEVPNLCAVATAIGADADSFEKTVAEHNDYAKSGNDLAFGRGTSDLNRINGDAANKPNPCMRPIGPGPFYAVAVCPADLATTAGLQGDGDGRVQDRSGAAIPGLYARGNDLASILRGTCPGPGTTRGPALVFGWRVAMRAAGRRGQGAMQAAA